MDTSGSVPTVDRLRADIDSGRTGEKVAAVDPAAAPLGTDAEAGGSPPTAAELRLESAARPIVPVPSESRRRTLFLTGMVVVLVLVCALLLGAGWMARN